MSLLLYDLSNLSSYKQEKSWSAILQRCISISDKICFNILYQSSDLFPVASRLKFQNYVGDKIYETGNSIICDVNQKTSEFAISLGFANKAHYFIEDVSLYINNIEFLATITHESYIICDSSIIEPAFFQKLGIVEFYEYS